MNLVSSHFRNETIAAFAASEDYQIESEVMNAHQKSSIGNSLIRTYMERDYIIPESFEDFVYVGLVLQGQGMRHGTGITDAIVLLYGDIVLAVERQLAGSILVKY